MSACDFLPLQLSVTIQELVPRVPPTIFVWFHPYVYFRSLVLGRLSLSASKYGRENLDRIFAGIENQTLNFMGKVPESAGFGKCRVLSHPASQPRIRGSFLFFFHPCRLGLFAPVVRLRLSARAIEGGVVCKCKERVVYGRLGPVATAI